MKKYKIRYLSIFKKDMRDTKDYISQTLQNPIAAKSLVEEIEKAILKRSEVPLSFEPVRLLYDPQHLYYRIYVKNYTIYYVVIKDVIEIRRLLYNKRNVKVI